MLVALEEVFKYGAQGLKPDEEITLADWSDKYRILSSTGSAEPGPWQTSRVPYLKEIMEALTIGSPYTKVVLMKGAQIGASEMGINLLGYIADIVPSPTLYLMPTLDAAKEFSKIRIDPLIAESERLKGKIKEARARDSGNTTLLKEFLGGYWALTGANSGVGLRSKPIRILILDEVDAYPRSAGGEGSPVKLAVARTRTYGNRKKIFITSSPKNRGESPIEAEFEETDKRYCNVPCPHCNGYQVLVWARMKWDNKDPSTARYICEHCEQPIYNHEKTWMLERRKWVATAESKDPSTVGFHLSALYSPVGWYSWSQAVADFLEAEKELQEDKSTESLQTFVNTVLGETWVDRADAPDWEVLYHRRETYQIGIVPAPCVLVTAAADVQKDRIELLIQGWTSRLEQYTVDYLQILGDTTQGDVWDRLDQTLIKPIPHESGVSMNLKAVAIDSGYLTSRVYAWSRKHRTDWLYVVKGVSSDSPVGSPRLVDVNFEGKKIANGARLWPVGVNTLKREVYTRLRLGLLDDGSYPDGFMHFPELPAEFFKQVTAESLQSSAKGKQAWKKHYDRNEALDMLVYNRALAIILGLDRLKEQEWQILQDRLVPSEKKTTIGPRPQRRVINRGIEL